MPIFIGVEATGQTVGRSEAQRAWRDERPTLDTGVGPHVCVISGLGPPQLSTSISVSRIECLGRENVEEGEAEWFTGVGSGAGCPHRVVCCVLASLAQRVRRVPAGIEGAIDISSVGSPKIGADAEELHVLPLAMSRPG